MGLVVLGVVQMSGGSDHARMSVVAVGNELRLVAAGGGVLS